MTRCFGTGRRVGSLLVAVGSLLSATTALSQTDARIFTDEKKWLSIQFPAPPTVTATRYDVVTPGGTKIAVPATLYDFKQNGSEYRVTVANLAGSVADDPHALEHAVTAFRRRKGIALDTAVSHSLGASGYQLCGRSFGYSGPGGKLNYQTLFYNDNAHLFYDIYSSVTLKAEPQHGAEVTHFQQSLALLADPASKLPAPLNYPDNWKLYDYPTARFGIRFPAAPTVEQAAYHTDGGINVPATRYWTRVGGTLYRLTVAQLWETEADNGNAVDEGVAVWKRHGEVIADDTVAVNAAQCGRDVALKSPQGTISRARIFFPSSQHRLYVIEVAQEVGNQTPDAADTDRFLQSFTVAKPE
ncbi:MAG: hypothetical protein JWO15_350 [Sphingomonadales bacterium]|nr:hypothetical protein [Sphingomonadales bacterium]